MRLDFPRTDLEDSTLARVACIPLASSNRCKERTDQSLGGESCCERQSLDGLFRALLHLDLRISAMFRLFGGISEPITSEHKKEKRNEPL